MLRVLRTHLLPYCSGRLRSRPSRFYGTVPRVSSETPLAHTRPSLLSRLLKIGAFTSIAGAIGVTSYVSYAYSLDEIDQMTRPIRTISSYLVEDDNIDEKSGLKKFKAHICSSITAIPVKSVELYMDTRRDVEEKVRCFFEPPSEKLLPDLLPQKQGKLTLVLDLNETLAYSDWKHDRGWRTVKRPGVDDFLERLAQFYEIVVYSDRQNLYVDPVLENLVQKGCISYKLSRSANRYINRDHYRDLSMLNRDPSRVIYISADALECCLQPENAVYIKPWRGDGSEDTVLWDLAPFLQYVAMDNPADIRSVLASYPKYDTASEFLRRVKEHYRWMHEQKEARNPWWDHWMY